MPTLTVGPFRWLRDDQDECEAWAVILPKDAGLAPFCVKNYGGTPNDGNPFTGWRLVGGGPFTSVGGWTSRKDAMRSVIPFLVDFYRRQAQEKLAAARRAERAADEFLRSMPTTKEK